MARLPNALLLSAAVLLLAHGAPSSAANPVCASNSVSFCWVGTATGGKYGPSEVRVTPLSSETGTYRPAVDGAVCNCFNATNPTSGDITYGFGDATTLQQQYSGNSQLGVANVCSSPNCNCGGAGCPIDPIATGICPATGSTGPLACRIGMTGTMTPWMNDAGVLTGPVLTFTAATPGNLASLNFTAGSVCIAEQFSASTNYFNTTVQGCISDFYHFTYNEVVDGISIMSNLTACTTNNCGAPAATGLACPASSSATRCTIGMTGPSGAVTALNAWLSDPDRYNATSSAAAPSSQPVPAGSACIAFTQPCSAHQQETITDLNAVTCPSNQSITVFMAMPTVPVSVFGGYIWGIEPPTYCNTVLTDFGAYNSTGFVACGTTNCNSATAPTYLAASAVLGGYTTTTFGTMQAGQFAYGMATALSVSYSAVTVTSVTATTMRRSLLAAGVNVGFTVQASVTSAPALSAALAVPLNAAVLKSAGLSAVTSVAITSSAPNAAVPVAIAASALPNTGTYVAPGSAAATPASMLAVAVAVAAATMLA